MIRIMLYLTPSDFWQNKNIFVSKLQMSIFLYLSTNCGVETSYSVGNLSQSIFMYDLWRYRRLVIIWINVDLLQIRPGGTCFNKVWTEMPAFSVSKMHAQKLLADDRPFCPGFLHYWLNSTSGNAFVAPLVPSFWLKNCTKLANFQTTVQVRQAVDMYCPEVTKSALCVMHIDNSHGDIWDNKKIMGCW